jgi:5-formyltetrahydrofolate cyclo-ligase
MSDTPPTKDEIRQQMRERRKAVTHEQRKTAGQAIAKNVLGDQLHLLLHAWRICVYLSTKHEIPTRYIVRAFWEAGREVCVPAWSQSNQNYQLYALDPRFPLVMGHFGIREPTVRIPVLPWDMDAFILPGLAFDALGGRLGFGAGHYDYILTKASKRAPKIALCYDWQILDGPLPQEAHDIPMDWIVSDTRVIHCAANRTSAGAAGRSASHAETPQKCALTTGKTGTELPLITLTSPT